MSRKRCAIASLSGLFFLTALSSAPTTYAPPLEYDTNRQGNDYWYSPITPADPEFCRDLCMDDPQCHAWKYAPMKENNEIGNCWRYSTQPGVTPEAGYVSGVINPLSQVQACREVRITVTPPGVSQPPVGCVGPDGWNYGKLGKTFKTGDDVWILARFQRLDPGTYQLSLVYSKMVGGKLVDYPDNRRVQTVRIDRINHQCYFRAHFIRDGPTRLRLSLSGPGIVPHPKYRFPFNGYIDYCYNCPLE